MPPAKIAPNARGNERQINLDKLMVNAPEGRIGLGALFGRQQVISWCDELTPDGISTTKEVPDWPPKFNGVVKTQSSLCGGSWQMPVPELKATGNTKQNKVDVSGPLQGNSYL